MTRQLDEEIINTRINRFDPRDCIYCSSNVECTRKYDDLLCGFDEDSLIEYMMDNWWNSAINMDSFLMRFGFKDRFAEVFKFGLFENDVTGEIVNPITKEIIEKGELIQPDGGF